MADTSIGQWIFFGTVALVIGSGGALLYGLPTVIALTLATGVLVGLLSLSKRVRFNARYQTQPQPAR